MVQRAEELCIGGRSVGIPLEVGCVQQVDLIDCCRAACQLWRGRADEVLQRAEVLCHLGHDYCSQACCIVRLDHSRQVPSCLSQAIAFGLR